MSRLVKLLLAPMLSATMAGAFGATYVIGGTFGTSVYSGPLNGGSFSGTYEFGVPDIGAFDVVLRDASNAVLAELTTANSIATFYPDFGGSGYDAIQFYRGPDATATVLSLNFMAGFTGVGSVVPYPAGYPYASFTTLNGQTAQTNSTVTSGFSIAAVPEPSSLLLFLFGGVALSLRRRPQVVRQPCI